MAVEVVQSSRRSGRVGGRASTTSRRASSQNGHVARQDGRRRFRVLLGGLIGVMLLAIAVGLVLLLARPGIRLASAPGALARVEMSGLGGRVSWIRLSDQGHPVRASVHNGTIVPATPVASGSRLVVSAELREPGWISWLSGPQVTVHTSVTAPAARLVTPVVVVGSGGVVTARFDRSVVRVQVVSSAGDPIINLAHPSAVVRVSGSVAAGQGGQVAVAGVPDTWESFPQATPLSYFGSDGSSTLAFLGQGAGTPDVPVNGPIDLVLSRPVAAVFGAQRPSLAPVINGALVPTGTWSEPNPYELSFTPNGPAFWPGEQVTMTLPAPVAITPAQGSPTTTITLTSASGSMLRLQQLLAELGYLPLQWTATAPGGDPTTLAGQAALVGAQPAGSFSWRWAMPAAFTSLWQPGAYDLITQGAVMTFEKVEGLDTTGLANPLLWPTLIQAVLKHSSDPYPYTWIEVSEQLPQQLWLYQNGQIVLSNLANTGIPQDPTATGTYPIYLRLSFQIMRGTNPNGSAYADPVHWINYFNGSDAVHGFYRASYGFPQSLGCVELPIAVAAKVWPLVHIGTLVTVLP